MAEPICRVCTEFIGTALRQQCRGKHVKRIACYPFDLLLGETPKTPFPTHRRLLGFSTADGSVTWKAYSVKINSALWGIKERPK